MWISLSNSAAMWFLGSPKNLKVSLNFQDRGPVEIDFDVLSLDEQKHILVSLRQNQITTDVAFDTLHEIYKENYEKTVAPVVATTPPRPPKKNKTEDLNQIALKRAAEVKERCQWLAQQTMRAIKAELKDEQDLKVLRSFYEMERQNKNRAGVLRLVENKLREHQKEVALSIEASSEEVPVSVRTPEATFPGNVIESEEVEVTLSPEQLKKMAARGLGGE